MSNDPSYNEREAARSRNHPMFHSSACLEARVDSFCDDTPDPGCTCGREAALRTGCKNCDEPRCNGHDCPNAPRAIRAWQIATGDLIGGRIVEEGEAAKIFNAPLHPYTQALVSAIPSLDPRQRFGRIVLSGDLPTPDDIPGGCRFHPRCPRVMDVCRHTSPKQTVYPSALVECHLY